MRIFWQKNFECPTPITSLPDKSATLIELNRTLLKSTGHFAKIRVLYLFLKNYVKSVADMPDGLTMALLQLRTQAGLQHSAINANVGQRQLERQFQRWLAMTPKQCQRVFRVARALTSIRNNLEESLASIAFESGFSDQAHMTREFKQIAKISPQAYRIQQIEKQSVVV